VTRNRPARPSSLGSACPGRWSPAGRRRAAGPARLAGPMVPVAGAERLSPPVRGKSTVMTVTPAARGRGGGRPVGEWVGIQAVSWDRKTHRRQDGDPPRRHTGPCGGCRRKALRQEAAVTPIEAPGSRCLLSRSPHAGTEEPGFGVPLGAGPASTPGCGRRRRGRPGLMARTGLTARTGLSYRASGTSALPRREQSGVCWTQVNGLPEE